MTGYKLTYWNARGRGEPIRMIFAAANVKYEDNRISKELWPTIKQSMPWAQIPILEFDGKILAQSITICRYLAEKYNLTGSNDWEKAKCDEYVDVLTDIVQAMKNIVHAENDTVRGIRKTTFLQESVPQCLRKFDEILSTQESSYLVGRKLTWTDIILVVMLERLEAPIYAGSSLLKNGYPNLKILRVAVLDYPGIKEWMETRPHE